MLSQNKSRLFTSLAAVALFALSGTHALALDPSKAPGQNFNLSNFQLQAWPCSSGSDTVVSQPQLATYQNTKFFYTGSDGSMVMWCPDQGGCTTGTNTTHQRTELRDLREYPATDTQLHVETATCVVLQLPKSGSTIIGQIHGDDPVTGAEALKLRCMVSGTDSSGKSVAVGTLLAGNKTTVGGSEVYSEFSPVAVAKIGDEIDYTIQWQNLKVTVTVVINKGSSHTYSYTLSGGSTWDKYPLYFKAGNYNQDDTDGTTDGALVAFYALDGPSQSQVAAPSFSPGGGTYTSAQNVTISSATSGASIRYTTDGSTPSETAGTIYSGAVNISSTKTLKAIAYESGDTDSSITSATYTIGTPPPPQVATTIFSPGNGTYTSAQAVTISDSTSSASIRYTADGSTPSETAGTLYSGSVSIAATTTLKAIAYKSGDTDSSIASATYTIGSGGGSCVTATSGGTWQNAALSTSETGTFTATFDATPSASPTNAVVGLSKGVQTAYTGFGCIARFNTSGDIDAYNNTGYVGTTIKYSAGVTYHFRMVVNVSAHTYSVYVTPAGGTELTVGLNYAFRSTQNTVTSLDHWGAFVDVAGSGGAGTLNVCNFAVQ